MTDAHDKYLSLVNVGGNGYYVKDAEARTAITAVEGRVSTNEADIVTLKAAVKDGAHYQGKIDLGDGKTTALEDGSTTNPVWIIGKTAAVTTSSRSRPRTRRLNSSGTALPGASSVRRASSRLSPTPTPARSPTPPLARFPPVPRRSRPTRSPTRRSLVRLLRSRVRSRALRATSR